MLSSEFVDQVVPIADVDAAYNAASRASQRARAEPLLAASRARI
jgi:hypothetical protein